MKATSELSEDIHAAVAQLNQQYPSAVIIPTYAALETQTAALMQESEAFRDNPTDANLAALRLTWQNVESTWAQSGAFAFGPVHSLGFSAALESPADTAGIDRLLAEVIAADSQTVPSATDPASLHPSLQGMEAISYLLGDKSADEFSQQERAYLAALSASAHTAASELWQVWQEGWNGYAPYRQAITTAGEPGNVFYLSPEAASEEIVRSLINSLDVMTNEILPEQLAETTARDVAVLAQVASGVEGIQKGYLGDSLEDLASAPTPSGGVSLLVESAYPDIHPQIQQSLSSAMDNLNLIVDEPSDTDSLERALAELTAVQAQLESAILPLVQTAQN